MKHVNDALLDILGEDPEVIPYRKSLRPITNSVTATILLQQIIHRSAKKNGEPFYKFKSPCGHDMYRAGDSWTEELGFSTKEFDTALSKIGTKITKGTSKDEAYAKTDPTGLVIYWTDAQRVTWYHLNRDLLGKYLSGIYLESNQREFTLDKSPKGIYMIPESPTESPTENGAKAQKPLETAENLFSAALYNADIPIAEVEDALAREGIVGQSAKPAKRPEDMTAEERLVESGWQIRDPARKALLWYVQACRKAGYIVSIPAADSERGYWRKTLLEHYNEYGDDLEILYQGAAGKARDGDWLAKIVSPKSLTNTMRGMQGYVLEEKTLNFDAEDNWTLKIE